MKRDNRLFQWLAGEAWTRVYVSHVWVNQGWRPAQIMAMLPGQGEFTQRYLIEYQMPNGTTALWEAGLKADGDMVQTHNIPYTRIPQEWWAALKEEGSELEMEPQQTSPAKVAEMKARMKNFLQGVSDER